MNFSLDQADNFTAENTTNKPYQDFNDSYLDDVNSYLFGGISVLTNCMLIYATSKVKSYTGSVRWAQYSMCFSRLVFSLSIVLTSPSIEYVAETESLYIIKNGLDLPLLVGETLLGMFIVSIVMSCNGPAVQYFQVALLLTSSTKKQKSSMITLIPLIIALPTVALVYFGYVPHFYNVQLAEYLLERMDDQGTTAFLIVTAHLARSDGNFNFDMMSQVCTFFILMVMAISLLVTVLCYWSIQRQMKCRSVKSGTNAGTQEQLNMVLLIQFLVPFLTIHIPFYITFILPFFNNEYEFLTDNVIYLFAWCPAINPLLVMIMVKNIREVIFMRPKSKVSTTSSTTFRVFTRS